MSEINDIEPNTSKAFTLKKGEPNLIGGNRSMKFSIELKSGGYIKGIIPANQKLTLCSEGNDFSDISITIDDESTKQIEVVK